MSRIFATLSIIAVVGLLINLVIGLSLDLHGNPDAEMIRLATVHRLAGVAAALVVVLVNSLVITYFIGTSRWCREVSDAYTLEPDYVQRSNALKRRTFPWALGGMLAIIALIALGGAADPATGREGTEEWVTPHLIGAIVGTAFIAWSFVVQWGYVAANHAIIEEVVAHVQKIRAEHGLEV